MASKSQKRREQKKARRRKRLQKERNQRANRGRFRYRLDVRFEGEWRTAKRFRTAEEVQAHLDETDAIRKRGDTEIIEGRVVDLRSLSGKVVAEVEPFHPEAGPSMEEAAQGCAGPAADQGPRQDILSVAQENFADSVGIAERHAVDRRD